MLRDLESSKYTCYGILHGLRFAVCQLFFGNLIQCNFDATLFYIYRRIVALDLSKFRASFAQNLQSCWLFFPRGVILLHCIKMRHVSNILYPSCLQIGVAKTYNIEIPLYIRQCSQIQHCHHLKITMKMKLLYKSYVM